MALEGEKEKKLKSSNLHVNLEKQATKLIQTSPLIICRPLPTFRLFTTSFGTLITVSQQLCGLGSEGEAKQTSRSEEVWVLQGYSFLKKYFKLIFYNT